MKEIGSMIIKRGMGLTHTQMVISIKDSGGTIPMQVMGLCILRQDKLKMENMKEVSVMVLEFKELVIQQLINQ